MRADLADAYGLWIPPAAPAEGPQAATIAVDLQVPRHLGCVRSPDPSTGLTLRCVSDPSLDSPTELAAAQRDEAPGVRPILFVDFGGVLAQRLQARLEQRFARATVDRGAIPVGVRLKYDIHGGRFGERDMRIELTAKADGETIAVVGRTHERLSPAHLAWFVPTLPLAGAGILLLDRLDREAVAAQAVDTLDRAAAQLAAELAARRLPAVPAVADLDVQERDPPAPPVEKPARTRHEREPEAERPAAAEEDLDAPVASLDEGEDLDAPTPRRTRHDRKGADRDEGSGEPEGREKERALPEDGDKELAEPVATARAVAPVEPAARPRLPRRPSRCEPTPPARVVSAAGDAQVAFALRDREAFLAAADEAARALPCADAPFIASQAAEFHRLVALRAFFEGDRDTAREAFRAASALEPGYLPPPRLAPPGSALGRVWGEARAAAPPVRVVLAVPEGARIWVDGREAAARPEGLPGLVQVGATDGGVAWTGYLGPSAALPGQPGGSSLALVPFAAIRSNDALPDEQRWGAAIEAPVPAETPAVALRDDAPAVPARLLPAPEDPGPLDLPPAVLRGGRGTVAAAIATGSAAAVLYGTAHLTRWRFDHVGPSRGLLWATDTCYLGSIGLGLASGTFTALAISGRRR